MAACEVCGAPGDCAHFGVFSCRACAAFFRRAIATGREYKCRKQGDCELGRGSQVMCRHCRLKKCRDLGMDPRLLDRNFSNRPRPPRISKQKSEDPSLTESVNDTPTCSPPHIVPPTLPTLSPGKVDFPLATSFAAGFQKHAAMHMSVARLTDPGNNVTNLFNPTMELVPGRFVDSVKTIARSISFLVDILSENFKPFSDLSDDQKVVVFRSFLPRFVVLDRAFHSIRFFKDKNDSRVLFDHNRYFDIDNLEEFYEGSNCDPKQTAEFFRPVLAHSRKYVYTEMIDMGMTDMEFGLLLGLVLWEHDSVGIEEETSNLAKQTKESIYVELFQVCGGKFPDAVQRMGRILNLIPVVHKVAQKMVDNFNVLNIFNIFDLDNVVEFLPKSFI